MSRFMEKKKSQKFSEEELAEGAYRSETKQAWASIKSCSRKHKNE